MRRDPPQGISTMNKEILNTIEVAELVHAEPSTVASLALRGEIPAASIGKSYIFLRDDVMRFVREKIERDTAERRNKRNPHAAGIVAQIAQPQRRQRGPRARPLPILPPVSPEK
jgi:excisionase family DNA binding protein